MRSFITKCLAFVLIGTVLVNIDHIYLFVSEKYKSEVDGHYIYHSIKKSKQKHKCKVLVIGDSVGRQLFSNYQFNEGICSLATNQAISLAGQYVLIENFLHAGNTPEKIVLVCTPSCLYNNLDQVYTYHYFVKPFFIRKNFEYFDPIVYEKLDEIPYIEFSHLPRILTSNWAPDYKRSYKNDFSFLSPVSLNYLERIKTVCEINNIEFSIVSVPVKKSFETEKKIEKYKKEVVENDLEDDFAAFFNEMQVLEDSCFVDNVHLKNPKEFTKVLVSQISEKKSIR